MAKPQVLVLSYDIFDLGYVLKLSNISEEKTFRKSKFITNTYVIEVDNQDDTFSVEYSGSIFHGTNWRYSTVEVYNRDEILIWKGVIIDIERDYLRREAKIICKNSFFQYRNIIVDYQSSGWETGAEAFKNICDAVGFTNYNIKAYQDSHAILNTNDCKLKCNFNTEDGVKFMEAIDKLAEYSNADLYVHFDELYFSHWTPFTGGVKVTLDANIRGNFKEISRVMTPEKNIINEYSIDYEGSGETPATDANSNDIGSISRGKFGTYRLNQFRTGDNGQIVFMDKTSATYIGESYIRESHIGNVEVNPKIPAIVDFKTFSDFRELITLRTLTRLTFDREGWDGSIFEVFKFTANEDRDEIIIRGVQRQ